MKKIKVYCVELDEWFESVAEASRKTGESIDKIRYSLWESSFTDGYTWRDEAWFEDYGMFLSEIYMEQNK